MTDDALWLDGNALAGFLERIAVLADRHVVRLPGTWTLDISRP